MLYKKYHRNFVRQFKKRTKVRYRYRYDNGTETETILGKVITEPFIYRSSITRRKYCWIEIELPNGFLKIIDETGRKLTGNVEAVN